MTTKASEENNNLDYGLCGFLNLAVSPPALDSRPRDSSSASNDVYLALRDYARLKRICRKWKTRFFCWIHGLPNGMKVRVALAEKGIKCEYQNESLLNKSPLLLQMNPIHKKIPVLIHNGRPISESLIIVEDIDEVWKDRSPLLPSDPYQHSQARFWPDFIVQKIHAYERRIWMRSGEEQEAARELIENFKVFEEVGDKPYFGGETMGFVDLSLVPFSAWFYTYETYGKFNMEAECPNLMAWAKRLMQKESVLKSLPDQHKIYEFASQRRKKIGLE